jgi:hypothetical protein
MNGKISGIISRTGSLLILVYLSWQGCAIISSPDSCESSRCSLEPSRNITLIELEAIGNTQQQLDYQVVEICACRNWNRSGIKVEKGQQYLFGVVEQTEPWIDGDVESTPEDGWTSGFYNLIGQIVSFLKRSNKANWYALIGTIEENDEDSFAVFRKGLNSTEAAPRSGEVSKSSDWPAVMMTKPGELYFYANDMNGRYFNNKGTLQLRITRIK